MNTTEELPGASLKVVSGESDGGAVVETWTSGTEAHKIRLVPGVYTLVETQAPAGYAVAESITFRVGLDGSVEVRNGDQWTARDKALIRMEDALVPVPAKPSKPSKAHLPSTGDGFGALVPSVLTAVAGGLFVLAYRRRRS